MVEQLSEFDAVGRIHALCQARSWSYYKLAQKSGIPYSTLNTMLRKTNAPSLPSLSKICDGFGITLAQFFSEQGSIQRLSESQRQCLTLWDALDDKGKTLAAAYMQGVRDAQGEK